MASAAAQTQDNLVPSSNEVGWMVVSNPGATETCGNSDNREWRVVNRNGKAFATLKWEYDFDNDSVPFRVDNELRTFSGGPSRFPRLRAVQVPDGWLVGWQNAPAGLRWYSKDGSRSYLILQVGVAKLLRVGDAIVAIVYSRSNDPSVRVDLLYKNERGIWYAERRQTLSGFPSVAVSTGQYALVAVGPSLERVDSNGSVHLVYQFQAAPQVGSIAVVGKLIYLGFAHYIAALKPNHTGLSEIWFAPSDCPRYGQVTPGRCYCVGASGVVSYQSYPFFITFGPGLMSIDKQDRLVFVNGRSISRVSPDGAVRTIEQNLPYQAMTSPPMYDGPSGLAVDSHDNIWFAPDPYRLWRVSVDGVYHVVGLPGSAINGSMYQRGMARIVGIAALSDGSVWYSDANEHQLGRIARSEEISTCTIDKAGSVLLAPGPNGLATAVDVKNWRFASLDPLCDFQWNNVPLPRTLLVSPVTASNGFLWAILPERNSLGIISKSGSVTLLPMSKTKPPFALAASTKNSVWALSEDTVTNFAEGSRGTQFTLPNENCTRVAIAADSSGGVWYGDQCGYVGHVSSTGRASVVQMSNYTSSSTPLPKPTTLRAETPSP